MKGKGGRDVELLKFFQVVLDVGGGNFWKFYEGRRDIGEKDGEGLRVLRGLRNFGNFTKDGRRPIDREK